MAGPICESVCLAGLNWAVIPIVVAISMSAEPLAWTAGSVCEVATAIKLRFPASAKTIAPTAIGTVADWPASSVTVGSGEAGHDGRRPGQRQVVGIFYRARVGHRHLNVLPG